MRPQSQQTINNKGDAMQLAKMFVPLLQGIVRLSDAGHIHGDIKSPNVVFSPDGKSLRFVDYDMLNTEPNTLSHNIMGTDVYYYAWPPELWLDKNKKPTFTILGAAGNIKYFLDKDIFVVNFFCITKYFNLIKPRYYILLDPFLFLEKNIWPANPKERVRCK
jgi:serine/threonine protein kinase